jgi:hypothetical protein
MKILGRFESYGSEDDNLQPVQVKLAYILLTDEEAVQIQQQNASVEMQLLSMIRQGLQNAN